MKAYVLKWEKLWRQVQSIQWLVLCSVIMTKTLLLSLMNMIRRCRRHGFRGTGTRRSLFSGVFLTAPSRQIPAFAAV